MGKSTPTYQLWRVAVQYMCILGCALFRPSLICQAASQPRFHPTRRQSTRTSKQPSASQHRPITAKHQSIYTACRAQKPDGHSAAHRYMAPYDYLVACSGHRADCHSEHRRETHGVECVVMMVMMQPLLFCLIVLSYVPSHPIIRFHPVQSFRPSSSHVYHPTIPE